MYIEYFAPSKDNASEHLYNANDDAKDDDNECNECIDGLSIF